MVERVVRTDRVVSAVDTIDIGRERERELRGGRARAGELYVLFWAEAEDSTECVMSDGDAGKLVFPSRITSLDELATLVMLLCGLVLSPKEGLGGTSSPVDMGVGYSDEFASSTAQLFSRVGPRLMV